MYIVFDTETTGLPKNYKAPISNTRNWPRMVQIAWQRYAEDNELIESKVYIIKPEGYTIPKQASDVHGITTEKAEKEGVDLTETLHEFRDALMQSEYLVAHNINFDQRIVGAEFFRKGIENLPKKLKRIDTMSGSTNYCRIPGKYGYKWPNLTELHTTLFNKGFDDAHDAMADVQACAKCFFELVKRGVIKLDND